MNFKKLTLFVLAVMLAGAAYYGCKPKTASSESPNVKYYRSLLFSETPWDTETGSYPLTAEQARTINNYKLTYDNLNRLVSAEYNRNGVLLDYSGMGAAKITYTYTDSLQMKHFFDQNGEPAENNGAFAFEYRLNKDGVRTGMRFLGKEGQPVENRNKINRYVWSRMPDGMIRELRYNLAGDSVVMNPFCPFYELRFSYNDKGFVTRLANYDNDTLYNCTAENCGDIGVSYFLFDLNEAGDVLQFSVHNTTGRLSNLYWGWAKRVNKVDANGYVTETAMFDQDDEYLGGKNVPVTQTVYDGHGAAVRRINMDKDRQMINSPADGTAYTEFSYDEQGRRTGTVRFNKEKVKIEDKK